ncbi:MAG TPA: DNA topoisomerase IB [Opitutaceae bacterium]|nr:DNA topoisomerase IB [Opitutaceae bacterium]
MPRNSSATSRTHSSPKTKVLALDEKKPSELPSNITPESVASAKAAGLRYVVDSGPGISRKAKGKTFVHIGADGKIVRDPKTLGRIKRLAIPPAWTDVWICPIENGHIQATGRDDRGRKQYRYHSDWQHVRDEDKYERMVAFGKALPRIRRRVARDLRRRGLGREKVLAAVIRLLEMTLIRIGNEEYARQNRSFGLSTMRDRHVNVRHGNIHFEFRGKSGKAHEIDLHDPRLAKVVREAQELPGQDLFQYVGEDGSPQKIRSEDVNEYLREIAGEEFSAKDFRTWSGTVLAAMALREFEAFDSKTQAKKNLVRAIETVAERLGNTPAVCRKCYVHPVVLESYMDGATVQVLQNKTEKVLRKDLTHLSAEEAAVMAFVQQRLSLAAKNKPGGTLTSVLRRSIKAEKTKRGKATEAAVRKTAAR